MDVSPAKPSSSSESSCAEKASSPEETVPAAKEEPEPVFIDEVVHFFCARAQ